jgi:hypothetical protein
MIRQVVIGQRLALVVNLPYCRKLPTVAVARLTLLVELADNMLHHEWADLDMVGFVACRRLDMLADLDMAGFAAGRSTVEQVEEKLQRSDRTDFWSCKLVQNP